jgi:hypothetical protein
MACKVLFTAGAKGGSGKTTAARLIVSYLQDHGIPPLILDLDDENRSLSRFYPEAFRVDIHQEFAHDVLIEKATSGHYPLIVADLKAGTGHEVLQWFLEVPFEQLKKDCVEFLCIGSITSAPDSVQSFLNWATALENRVSYLVFKNLKDGDQLYDYERTQQAIQFQDRTRPSHVVIPKLSPRYQTELEIRSLTISEVLNGENGISARGNPLGPVLSSLMGRARLRNYQQVIYDQLDAVQEVLLPTMLSRTELSV